MKLYLASPHTFLRFKEGFKLYESILAERNGMHSMLEGMVKDGNIFSRGYICKS